MFGLVGGDLLLAYLANFLEELLLVNFFFALGLLTRMATVG
jgi:hypothetical protein